MMRTQSICLILAFGLLPPFGRSQPVYTGAGYTHVGAGDVSGTWTQAGSPYHVLGEIAIPNGETLTIEPGVNVVFMGHYKLNVQGRLLAVGTQHDTIRFIAENVGEGWHGIRFIDTPNTNDTSRIVYCELGNGKANTGSGLDRSGGAMLISGYDKVLVAHSLFHSNMNDCNFIPSGGPAIYISSASPIITNSTFTANTGTTDGAIGCWGGSHAIISKNVFSMNRGTHGAILCANYNSTSPSISGNIISYNVASVAGGGIFIWMSTALIENNVIVFNQSPEGGGIKCYVGGSPICINNTVAYNSGQWGGAICCHGNADPIFLNDIVWGNTGTVGDQVNLMDIESDPVFQYCDIQGGDGGFRGAGAGVYYTGVYENNVDCDPRFNNVALGDLSLSNASPCIGAGIDSLEIANVWHHVPPFCIMGNPRPSPKGSKPDIGACENLTTAGVGQVQTRPEEFALYQNYPNPFNPKTVIRYQLSVVSDVRLGVYDLLGREVAALVNERKAPGSYTVQFDASGLASGVYFYSIQAGNFVQTKKLLLLR